jgi:mannosyltransferase
VVADEASAKVVARSSALAVDAAVAACLALVLGLIRLGTPSLWFDEAYTARVVEQTPQDWLESDQYHFLYDAIVTAWATVAGTSEWALRFPSVIAAACAAALVVVLADRLRLDRWVGLMAGLFLATSPFVVKWSQQARGYTFLLVLCLVSTLLLVRALDRGTRATWAAYGLSISCVVVWHAVGGLLLVPAHAVLIAQRRERFMPHGLLAVVIASAVAIPWAATIVLRTSGEDAGIAWLEAPSAATVVHAFADLSGAAGLGMLLAMAGLVVLARSGKSELAAWLGVWALSPALLALLVTIVRPVFLDRYLIVASPAFALLAACAVVYAGRRLGPVLALAAAVVSAIALASWYSTSDEGNWRGEDWRGAVAELRAKSGGSDVVVAPWWANLAASYYGASPVSASTDDSVWVLTWSETGHALPPAERASLGFGQHELVERQDFGRRVSLQHWVRRG